MKTIQLTDKNALKIQRRELRQPGAESRYSNNKAEDS